jgi:hypothetical protein
MQSIGRGTQKSRRRILKLRMDTKAPYFFHSQYILGAELEKISETSARQERSGQFSDAADSNTGAESRTDATPNAFSLAQFPSVYVGFAQLFYS